MEVRAGYQLTQLGVIPAEWSVLPLKQISPSQSVGLVINPSTYIDSRGTVPMLLGSDVQPNKIDFENSRKITESSNRKIPASQLSAGDLVIVRVGEPGITAVIPQEFDGCNCASMMIVRKGANFDSNWLCQLMNSDLGLSQVHGVQYGTAQKQFNISDAVNFLYPTPSLAEQRAIATTLSDVDALIAGLEKLITKKRDLKQAAMQQLLTGQTRLPGFSGEWVSVKLGDLLNVCHGKSQHAVEVPDGPYPILATGGQIGTASKSLHDRPSVLIGRKGTINKPQYMDTPFWTVDTLFYCYVHLPNSAKFLFYRFLLIDWMQYNEASGVPSLNGRTIERIEVKCPNAEEQTAISVVLSDIDADLAALEVRLAKTRALKQGMMQELLTGRTRLV